MMPQPARAFAQLTRPIHSQDIHSLREHLQVALELEHSTIPPYLYALYSIQDGSNPDAVAQIRSVVMEEMLHMTLVANILNAIGGEPYLNHPDFIPQYPTYLPQSNNAFVVNLARFSPASIQTFMRIELPEKPHTPPTTHHYSTIGQFYAAIEKALKEICRNNRHFVKDHSRQITPEYYYNAGGAISPVTNLEQALQALCQIVDQGEGVDHSIWDNEHHHWDGPPEYAHYFRFQEIHLGRFYTAGDTPKSGPTGIPLTVDWNAVYPARSNPKASDYPAGSQLRKFCDAFNATYTGLLNSLHLAFNGRPRELLRAVPLMYELRYQAVALMNIPYGDAGQTAGPSFEYLT